MAERARVLERHYVSELTILPEDASPGGLVQGLGTPTTQEALVRDAVAGGWNRSDGSPSTLSSDSDRRYLYVGRGDEIVVVDRASLQIIGNIQLPGTIGGGHQIAVGSRSNIDVGRATRGLQKPVFTGARLPHGGARSPLHRDHDHGKRRG
jgi:hypothetical protein